MKNIPLTSNQSPTNRSADNGKEVVNTYQSIPNTHTTDTASNIFYTPLLSDVTNGTYLFLINSLKTTYFHYVFVFVYHIFCFTASIPNNDYTSPKFNRRIRRQYLDSKKQVMNSTSPNIPISSTQPCLTVCQSMVVSFL